MKKQILFIAASALLVSCGNHSSSSYVSVPPVASSSVAPEAAAKPLNSLASNMGQQNAIGVSLTESLDLSASFSQAGQSASLSLKVKDAKTSIALNGLGTGPLKGSASASGKVSGELSYVTPAVDYSTQSSTQAIRHLVTDETEIKGNAFIEEGTVYTEVSGLSSSFKETISILPTLFGKSGDTVDFSKIEGKHKNALDEEALGALTSLPSMLSSGLLTVASELAKPAPSSSQSGLNIKDFFTFQDYRNGEHGLLAEIDVTKLIRDLGFGQMKSVDSSAGADERIGAAIGNVFSAIFSGFSGSAKALVIYSNTEIKSVALDVDLGYTLNTATISPASSEASSPALTASMKFGAKAEFSYGSAVKVLSVTDKDSYLA